ncbi:MAG: maltotransferase domain-containing protein [Nocardioidaceae bacterium]
MVERIPIMNVRPVVELGRYPVKAVTGESFIVEATVFREGHESLGAGVVLTDPDGKDRPLTTLTRLDGVPDRYTATNTPDTTGAWSFRVESWSDAYASWRHAAEIKIAADIDVELMLAEGALVLDRADMHIANMAPKSAEGKQARATLHSAVGAARDTSFPIPVRLRALTSPEVVAALRDFPLREMLSTEGPFGLYVDRPRALYGSWYEFFPGQRSRVRR